MKSLNVQTPARFDLVANARFACYLPLGVLMLGQIVHFLNLPSPNQHTNPLFYVFLNLWFVSLYGLPLLGIAWGFLAWRRWPGKLAAAINLLFLLLYALRGSQSTLLGF
jgi:hypothetical protein